MATLLIATPFVHSKALLTHAMVSDVRGLQPQKRLRVSCRQASVTASGDDGSSRVDKGAVLQSSSGQDASIVDWMSIFFEKEGVHEQAPLPAAGPPFQLLEPPKLRQGERRRSERTVVFTEEKARRLRKENRATQTFHDKWYHSAIASRLATPE